VKKVLIITAHFPPGNLAAVHRSRLFAQHLPEFGWEPIILTVDEKYYEEELDWNLVKLLPPSLKIYKSKSFPVTKPRIIGDIGLRAFLFLYRKAKQIIKEEKIDFVYIPIPFFYLALLGRLLHRSTGVLYGIDYIDPWVHKFPGSEKIFSRHWFSAKLARVLEPMAVKRASLITGVAESYYKGVIERNPALTGHAIFGSMPYGGERADHEKIKFLELKPYLFEKRQEKIQLVYAGAMLPKAYEPLENIFKAISKNGAEFSNVEFHFIGSGKVPNDPNSYNIKPMAEKYGLWQTIIFEYPARIPYLDVLTHLEAATGVFILGSTEPHYTPSKVYQGVLSFKPILAVLHKESTAVQVLKESGAGIVVEFNGEQEVSIIEQIFPYHFNRYLEWIKVYDPHKIKMEFFNEYSAKNVTKTLAGLLDDVMK
jgi:glycosyltransferase involved in cell wall biosynthesis